MSQRERIAMQAALNARMTGRRGCLTEKVKVPGLAAVYLHVEFDDGMRPVKFRISAPGKYSDQQIGALLDALAERVTAAIRREAKGV